MRSDLRMCPAIGCRDPRNALFLVCHCPNRIKILKKSERNLLSDLATATEDVTLKAVINKILERDV